MVHYIMTGKIIYPPYLWSSFSGGYSWWGLFMVRGYLLHMDYSITEKRLTEVLHKYLSKTIKGFDKCDYDWAEFGCGMGVCCDPYAIGFVLPDKNYDDYLFKLVDGEYYDDDGDYPEELRGDLPEVCHNPPNIQYGEFDTVIIREELYRTIRKVFGDINIWRNSLLHLLNEVYGFNARTLMSDSIYDW